MNIIIHIYYNIICFLLGINGRKVKGNENLCFHQLSLIQMSANV